MSAERAWTGVRSCPAVITPANSWRTQMEEALESINNFDADRLTNIHAVPQKVIDGWFKLRC